MGAQVSVLVDELIDAKVQNEEAEQIRVLLLVDAATANSDENREIFVEERGVKICSELVSSNSYEVATLATRVLGNVALHADLVAKINSEIDYNDLILQLNIYPADFCREALRAIANLAITSVLQQLLLELGIHSPLLRLVDSSDRNIRFQACRVYERLTENMAVARILIGRELLEVFLRLTNHTDDLIRRSAIRSLANMAHGEDTKRALIRHGAILQFFLVYDETKDPRVKTEALRGIKHFTELFVKLSNMRYLKAEDVEMIEGQTMLTFPPPISHVEWDIDLKLLRREAVARMLYRMESTIAGILGAEQVVIWIHDPLLKKLWTHSPQLISLDHDLKSEDVISVSELTGVLGESILSNRREVLDDASLDMWMANEFNNLLHRVCHDTLIEPLYDRNTRKSYGLLQIVNKSIEEEENEEDEEEEEEDTMFRSQSSAAKKVKVRESRYTADVIRKTESLAARVTKIIPMVIDKHRLIQSNQAMFDKKDTRRTSFDLNIVELARTDVRTVIKVIMSHAKKAILCQVGSFYLHDSDLGVLWGVKDDGISDFKMPNSKGIAGRVAREGKPTLIRDVYSDPDFNPEFDRKTGFRTRNMLLVPVKSFRQQNDPNGVVIGVFQMINKTVGEFNKADMQKLQELKTLCLSVLESKMSELRSELHERRGQNANAIDVIIRATSDKSYDVRIEAAKALCNVAFTEINHDKLIAAGVVKAMIRLVGSTHGVVENVQAVVTPKTAGRTMELRNAALQALASLSANGTIREVLVEQGSMDLFLSYVTSGNDLVRYQALRGIANLATVRSTHEKLLTRRFLSELQLQSESTNLDDVVQVVRCIVQLASFRENLDYLYNNRAWDIVWEVIIEAPIKTRFEEYQDVVFICSEVSALMCSQKDIRHLYLTDKPARKLLDTLWDTHSNRIQAQVVRHFVYILETPASHALFFETAGLEQFERAMELLESARGGALNAHVEQALTYLAEAFVELCKTPQSLLQMLDWGLLASVKKLCTSCTTADMLYSCGRVMQIAGADQSNRSRMIDMRMTKNISSFLKCRSNEIKLEGLEVIRVLCERTEQTGEQNRKYLQELEKIAIELVPDLVELIVHDLEEPEFAVVIPAARVLMLLSQSPNNRIKIIQTGLVSDLINISQGDVGFGPYADYKMVARELLVVLDDGVIVK